MNKEAQQPQDTLSDPKELPRELVGESLPIPTSLEKSPSAREALPMSSARPVEGAAISAEGLTFTTHVHDYVNEYVRFADQKAAVVVTFSSAMLGFLQTQDLLPIPELEFSPMGVIRLLAPLGLGLAIVLASFVVFPRRRGKASGLVFWGAIAERRSPHAYEAAVQSNSPAQLETELARHTYEVAVICQTKYQGLAWAMIAGVVGVLASIILILGSRV